MPFIKIYFLPGAAC